MKHLKVFQTESSFENVKANLDEPWVALTEDDNNVHYIDDGESNPFEFVDLELPSGRLWDTMNVGANSETEYGKYFQWGDTEGYYDNESHYFHWETYKYVDNYSFAKYNESDGNTVLEPEDDAAHINMGGDWRMPTKEDFLELYGGTNKEWIEDYKGSGVNGVLFTSRTNGNSIFIPASGNRYQSELEYQSECVYLWSSSVSDDTDYAWDFEFNPYYFNVDWRDRLYGFCVRGVM